MKFRGKSVSLLLACKYVLQKFGDGFGRLAGAKLRGGTDYRYDQQANRLTVSFQGASKIAIAGAESLF